MVWLLVGCGTLIVIAVIAAFLGGYGVRNQSAALAIAKALVAEHPDVFEISVDDEKRLVTIRNKQTGKTDTLDMDAGRQAFSYPMGTRETGKTSLDMDVIRDGSIIVALPADGEFFVGRDKVAQADIPARIRNILKDKRADEQVVYIKSGKEVKYGTVVSVIDAIRDAGFDRIGIVAEKEKLPEWFPSYPGAVVHQTFSSESKDGKGASFGFSTRDSIDKVVKFYEENLKQAGLKVTANTVQKNGAVSEVSLASEGRDKERNVSVTAILEKDQTHVTVVFASK